MFSGRAVVPNARDNQHDRTSGGEQYQERRREHEPCNHGRARRQAGAEVAVEGTGLGVPAELLVNRRKLRHHCISAIKRFGAGCGAGQARRVALVDAVRAKSPTAVSAHRDRLCRVMLEAVHLSKVVMYLAIAENLASPTRYYLFGGLTAAVFFSRGRRDWRRASRALSWRTASPAACCRVVDFWTRKPPLSRFCR